MLPILYTLKNVKRFLETHPDIAPKVRLITSDEIGFTADVGDKQEERFDFPFNAGAFYEILGLPEPTNESAAAIVNRLIEGQQDMRFDLNARVEVWVTREDLEADERIQALHSSPDPVDQKVISAKAVAREIAESKLATISKNGIDISADFSPDSVNVNRINWQELVSPPRSEDDEAAFDDETL